MPARTTVVLLVGSLMLPGCASYRLEPLSVSHPVHPEAAAAPDRPLSPTLADTPSDIPSVRLVPPVAAAPHQRQGSGMTGAKGSPTVVGEGEVVSTVPTASQIVVDHGEIIGSIRPRCWRG